MAAAALPGEEEAAALVLRSATQAGKTTFANSVALTPGAPMPTGSGAGESVTAEPIALRTQVGLVVDGAGDDDTRLRQSNAQAGQRYAAHIFAAGVLAVKFLVFESLCADSMKLRRSLESLAQAFGAQAVRGVLVVATKPDRVKAEHLELRSRKLREVMKEQGLTQMVTWQGVGLEGAAFQAQLAALRAALRLVPTVQIGQLEELHARQRRRAQELCDAQRPQTREVEVEEQVQEAYSDQEEYMGVEVRRETVDETVQEPYTHEETYTETAFDVRDERYVEHVPSVALETRTQTQTVVEFERGQGLLGALFNAQVPVQRTVERDVQVPVATTRPVEKTRQVITSRDVQKTRQVVRYREATKKKEVSNPHAVTKCRRVVKYRPVARSVTKTVEYTLPVESFMHQARAEIVEEIRELFRQPA